jgi:hypothetical protein
MEPRLIIVSSAFGLPLNLLDEGVQDEAEYVWTSERLRQLGASSSAITPPPGTTPPPSSLHPTSAAAAAPSPEPSGLHAHLPWTQGKTLASLDPAVAAGLVGAPVPGMVLAGVGPEGYIYRPLTAEDFQVGACVTCFCYHHMQTSSSPHSCCTQRSQGWKHAFEC